MLHLFDDSNVDEEEVDISEANDIEESDIARYFTVFMKSDIARYFTVLMEYDIARYFIVLMESDIARYFTVLMESDISRLLVQISHLTGLVKLIDVSFQDPSGIKDKISYCLTLTSAYEQLAKMPLVLSSALPDLLFHLLLIPAHFSE